MSRFWKAATKPVALTVLLSFVWSIGAPLALAQSRESEYRPDSLEEQEFAGDVASHVALKEDLEKRWADASSRSERARRQLARLQQGPAAGQSQEEWQNQVSQLERYIIANDRAIGDYRRNLGSVYSQLDRDKQRLYGVRDEGLRQNLGTLLGVGGMAAVPLANRPSIGNLSGAIRRGMQGRQLASVTNKIAQGQARSAQMGDKLANATPPTKNTWTTVTENGRVLVKGADGTVKDMGAATTKSANGTDIKNDVAYRRSEYYNQLYGTKSSLQNQIDSLRHNRDIAKTTKAKDALDKRITELETKKVQLEKDIAEYDSTKQSHGSQLKNLAMGAAKWAAFGAGMTVATNAITQMTQNGWDPAKIDWGAAIAPLKTAEFWGGTAGSFTVSMLASSLIPGGAFIKTLTAIGGAAIGWQLGTGNIGQTDWMELTATSLGATVGTLIGTALGGPIGGFLGGIAGNFAATWLLGKLREWLEPSVEASYPREGYPTAQDPPGWNRYGGPEQMAVDPYQSSDPSDLKARMDEAYVRMTQYARDPSQMQKFDASRREYMMLKAQLEQLRGAGQP